jgi:FKBP-type peptidyl-prolyl cis-trans isomerase SlpA
MSLVIGPKSFVTLHYRIMLAETGTELLSTFADRPATLQLGAGQLAEPLERRLIGMSEGDQRTFDLPAGEAFGQRSGELVRPVPLDLIRRHADSAETFEPGDLIEFTAPAGGRFAGVLKSIDADRALLDFNHPLAGESVRFEVKIVGVMQ